MTGLKELQMPHCQNVAFLGVNSAEGEQLSKNISKIVITTDKDVPDGCFKAF